MEQVINRLKTYFDPFVSTTAEFWMRHAHHVQVREIPNKTLIKPARTRESELRFLLKGAATVLLEKADDKEMSIDLCFEDQFLCDFKSLSSGKPSNIYIRNFEDIQMAVISDEAIIEMLRMSVEANHLSRILLQQQIVRAHTYIENYGKNSLERYDALKKLYGRDFYRIPLRIVASYLGVSQEWVSRIRRKHE